MACRVVWMLHGSTRSVTYRAEDGSGRTTNAQLYEAGPVCYADDATVLHGWSSNQLTSYDTTALGSQQADIGSPDRLGGVTLSSLLSVDGTLHGADGTRVFRIDRTGWRRGEDLSGQQLPTTPFTTVPFTVVAGA